MGAIEMALLFGSLNPISCMFSVTYQVYLLLF
jgi:hypothetical protein